jgi:hypothetical protein
MRNPPNLVELQKLVHENIFDSRKPSLRKDVHEVSAVRRRVVITQENDMRAHVLQVFCNDHACERVVVVFFLTEPTIKESAKPAEPPAAYVRPTHLIRVSAKRVTRHARP